jgi:hypothetical protein
MSHNISYEYAKKLARRWNDGEIACTYYYYLQARKCLRYFGHYMTSEEHSLIAGIVEYYNFNR